MAELTPMMQQYLKTKEENPDCILFYRLGDFYEMFFEDALTASKELEITKGKEKVSPLASNKKPFDTWNQIMASTLFCLRQGELQQM